MGLLLKDISLSESQRAQIAQLHKAEREQGQAKREQRKTELAKLREARQRHDTVALRAAIQQRREAMQQERARHLAALRQILTPEQRVQFDRNVAELKARQTARPSKQARVSRL